MIKEISDKYFKDTQISRLVSIHFYYLSRLLVLIFVISFLFIDDQDILVNENSWYYLITATFLITSILPIVLTTSKNQSQRISSRLDLALVINSILDWSTLYFTKQMTSFDCNLIVHVGFMIVFFYSFYHPFLSRNKIDNSNHIYFSNPGFINLLVLSLFIYQWQIDLSYDYLNIYLIFISLIFSSFFLNYIQIKWSEIDYEKEDLISENKLLLDSSKSSIEKKHFINKSLLAISELGSRDSNLKQIKQRIVELTADVFGSEFCSIGKVNFDIIQDEFTYSNIECEMQEYKECPINESLVGNVIINKESFIWNGNDKLDFISTVKEKYGITLSNERVDYYNSNILKSGTHKNVFIKGLYHKNVPYGFIHVINFKNEQNTDELTEYLNSIETILNNYNTLNQIIIDEKEINKSYEAPSIDIAINQVLIYIQEQFKPDFSTFWVPIRDGVQEEESDKLLLRNLVAKNNEFLSSITNKRNTIREIDDEIKKLLLTKEIQISSNYNSNLFDNLKVFKKVTIPISISKPFEKKHKFENWGVFIIYYLSETQTNITSQIPRLEFLTSNYKYLFERSIFSGRYNKIENLGKRIKQLDRSSTHLFYSNLVFLINDIMHCQATSVFSIDMSGDYLTLKASTASSFINHNDSIVYSNNDIEDMIAKNDPIYSLVESDSLTATSFNTDKSIIVNMVQDSDYTNYSFMENTSDFEHLSILLVPLKINKQNVGVIRCINKEITDDNFYGTNFNEGDRELIEIISELVSPLLSSINLNQGMLDAIINIAHETRTPLSSILGNVELIKFIIGQRVNSSDMNNSFESIFNQINLISELITDFKKIRIDEVKKEERIIESVNVNSFIKSISASFRKNELEKNIRLKPFSKSKDASINISRKDLYQILYNLIKNAFNYSFNDTDILLIHEFKDYHEFKIVNYGIGIPPNEVEKIFIFKYRGTNAEKLEGSGIGLHITKQIIEESGGTIEVTSINNPTEFVVKL